MKKKSPMQIIMAKTSPLTFGEDEPEKSNITLENHTVKRLTFQVDDQVSDETLNSTLKTIFDNDNLIGELLTTTIVRDQALFCQVELSKNTLENLREAFSRLSANYLLIRSLTGWPQLGLSASNLNPAADSILGLVMTEVIESFRKSGLIVEPEIETEGN